MTTLKRSHDQITAPENETAKHSSKKEGASEDAVELLTVYPRAAEKHAKLLAAGDSPKDVASYAIVGTFHQEGLPRKSETTMEKSDHPNQIDGQSQLQQKLSDRVAGVSSQHGVMLSVSHSGRSMQGDMNAREIGAAVAPMSSHSMPVGKAYITQNLIVQYVSNHSAVMCGPDNSNLCVTLCKGIQDSFGFWIPRRGFWILDSTTWILHSLSVELGFRILELYSGFHKQKFPRFRNLDSLHMGPCV